MSIGVEVNTRLAPASRGIPTLTDTLFVAGWVATGVAATPRPLRSIGDFELVHGARVTGNQVLYDGLDAAWNETPGATAYGKLRTHALNNNRFALYDVALDADVAAMTTSGGATVDNDEYGMVAGQWLDIPAVAGSIGGSARQVPGSAVLAALIARSDALGKTIDGRRRLTGRLKTDLDAICLELYGVDGLFGETPSDAFATEAGASVNTIDGIAQGELRGIVEARFSLHTKRVLIDLVSVPITGQVSQAV
jgi:hypothetical protein